jgi:hypothetical protein
MEVSYPKDLKQKQLPPEKEVEEVVIAVCQICGFDPSRVRINYVGGDRRRKFNERGMKIMRYNPHTVQVLIGCVSDTVEAHFQVIDSNKRALPGSDVFSTMSRAFKGKYSLVLNDEILRKALHGNGSNGKTHENGPAITIPTETAPAPTESGRPSPVKDVQTQVHVETIMERQPDESVIGGEKPATETEPEQLIVGSHYFDDLTKLHTAVCALVILCNEDTRAPFSFEIFKQALEETKVPKTAGEPAALIRTFLRRFIERISDTNPPRYLLTEAAITYARGNALDCPPKISQSSRKSTGPTADNKEVITESTREAIIRLKRKSDEHRAIMESLATARAKLAKLKETDIDKELADIDGQEVNLKKRLAVIEEYRLVLAERRLDIVATDKEIRSLTEQAEDSKTTQALNELAELRKLLG